MTASGDGTAKVEAADTKDREVTQSISTPTKVTREAGVQSLPIVGPSQ